MSRRSRRAKRRLSRVYKNALPERWNELVPQQTFKEEWVCLWTIVSSENSLKLPVGDLASLLTMYGTAPPQGNHSRWYTNHMDRFGWSDPSYWVRASFVACPCIICPSCCRFVLRVLFTVVVTGSVAFRPYFNYSNLYTQCTPNQMWYMLCIFRGPYVLHFR